MNDKPDAHQSCLLRLWRAKGRGKWQWYVSIESPQTGEHQWFASLVQVFGYLSEQCEGQAPGAGEG